MSFVSGLVENVFFLRWLVPEPGDSAKLMEQVAAARARTKGPLVYVGIASTQSATPDDRARAEIASNLDRLVATCDCVHVVFEGSGFKASIIRAVAAGMLLVSGRRSQVQNNVSVSQALSECEHLSAPMAVILRQAKNRGLLWDAPPSAPADEPRRKRGSSLIERD